MHRTAAERFRVGLFPALFTLAVLIAVGGARLHAQSENDSIPHFFLDTIRFHRIDIADTSEPLSGFDRLMNATHVLTKEGIVSAATGVTLDLYDTVTDHALDELELYLRDLHVFSSIGYDVALSREPVTHGRGRRQKTDTITTGQVDVITQDAWKLYPEPFSEDGDDRLAWVLFDGNVLGLARKASIGGDLISPSDSLWRGVFLYKDPNLFGSRFRMRSRLVYSQPVTQVRATFERPFYSNRTPRGYGVGLRFADGDDRFFFRNPLRNGGDDLFYTSDTNVSRRYGFDAWVGFSNKERDQFRSSLALSYNVVDTLSGTPYPRAMDNSVGIFGGISSLRRKFVHIRDYEFSGTALVPIGGQGRISIGKISPVNGGLDNLLYVGAEARQSVLWGDFYGFASVEAGTAVRRRQAEQTLFRATASCGFPAGPGVVAAKVEQSTIWRWPRYVLLSLGQHGEHVRGLSYLDAFGDNRLLANFDYRLFPVLDIGFWDVGLAAFADVGGVWDQGQLFSKTEFHSTAGLGVRLGDSGGVDGGFLRVDVAWKFREREFGLDIGFKEAFDIFGTFEYSPPAPYIP